MTYALKQPANGKEVEMTPQNLVLEGLYRSGILGPLMEYNNIAEKASGGMVGLLGTLTDVIPGVLNGDAGDRVIHNACTFLPGNNLF
ncbi:hypothetical protein SMATCC274_17180 [Serratia marcescens]|nr:hypothetical protein SMATCC274_17180 [Serratia marcescens]